MCLYPTIMLNPKYKANKKNGGNPPPLKDIRIKYVPVPCKKCIECRKAISRDWKIRMLEDIKVHKNGHMVTLTINNESLNELGAIVLKKGYKSKIDKETGEIIDKKISGANIDNEIATLAVRRWTERHRKKYGTTIRHWLVTELGHNNTERIHLHGIVYTNLPREVIGEHWHYGNVWSGYSKRTYVSARTINYIIKYYTKQDKKHPHFRGITLCSKGIGENYKNRENYKRNQYKGIETKEEYIAESGHKMAMPKYYKTKLWTEEQREELWIAKLNKPYRYVMGREVPNELYEEAIKEARILNKRQGYGSNEINTKEREAEENERLVKYINASLDSK